MEIFCACAPAAIANNSAAIKRIVNFMLSPPKGCGILLRLHAETCQRRGAASARFAVDPGVQAAAVTVHRHHQRAETAHAELPERYRVQVIEIHILDRLDPGGLEGRR